MTCLYDQATRVSYNLDMVKWRHTIVSNKLIVCQSLLDVYPFKNWIWLTWIPLSDGTLASSQKAKLDKMKAWDNNPLKAYECKKKKNKNYYYLVAKDNQLVCAGCKSSRVNKSCSMVRCKNCCIKHCLEEGKVCKCKDHQKGMKERKQKALERCADAGIYDEDCIEAMIECDVFDSE